MPKIIYADDILKEAKHIGAESCVIPISSIENAPEADVVPKEMYDKLLQAALKMHCWIFLNSYDEEEAYSQCGLDEEINRILGYRGKIEIRTDAKINTPITVIRCKDCMHWKKDDASQNYCEYAGWRVGENGYCLYGESKKEI